jgi:hypothetical protein
MKMLSVFPRIQGDHKGTAKRMGQSRQIQNRGRDTKLLLFLVNSWAQEGVSAFQKKQFENLLTSVIFN